MVIEQYLNKNLNNVLFKSANYRTWTNEQMEDLKFKLNRAEFSTTSSGTLTLANKTLPTKHFR